MKRLLIHLEDEEYEKLRKIKERYKKTWKEFILELAEEIYSKGEIPKESLKKAYLAQARALAELGKLLIKQEEDFDIDDEAYLVSLLPLLIFGERISEDDLVKLGILVTNVVFNHLQEKYKNDEKLWFILEHMRVAIIRALKGDLTTYVKLMKEACKGLDEFPLSH